MFLKNLDFLKKNRLFREIKDRSSAQGPRIRFGENEFINFSSNDYLGLSAHPYLIEIVKKAIEEYGYGSSASRLLGGGSILHRELESKIAQLKKTESALLFNSGYLANIGIIPSIADENTVLLSDEFNHASIIDGCRLSKANILIYRHKDILHLEELLRKSGSKRKVIVTDTVFSMEGDIAPLKEIVELCKIHSAVLYLDDAHGTGVLGNGRGALSHFDINPYPWIVQMGTLSKAIGSFGAFASGDKDIIDWLINTSRSFIFSTTLPACNVAAALAGIELIEKDKGLIKKLWMNREKLVQLLKDSDYNVMGSETPIIPISTGTLENTLKLSEHLYNKGIYAPAIRPPTVKEPRIRITVTASHTNEDIGRLIEVLNEYG
ncbi:MAG: 8-amino-7-oxononanoate synthase [Nitrospirae bacterium]|nr:8-amino-7-oxononanoate synthase [Nitrospirota bacterium]